MRKAAGILLGAALGVLCTSFGLIDLTPGYINLAGGNEWTPWLTGGGAVAGAIIGGTSIFRRRTLAALLLGLGLTIAIALRDHYMLQPPAVFFDLFGLALLGAILGALLDRWREKSNARPGVIAMIGGMAIAIAVVVVFLASSGSGSGNCQDTGRFIRCGPLQKDG